MNYQIVRGMPEVPAYSPRRRKCPERVAMEALGVGDGFWLDDHEAMQRARSARFELAPRKFSVRKVAGQGWQVRRVA